MTITKKEPTNLETEQRIWTLTLTEKEMFHVLFTGLMAAFGHETPEDERKLLIGALIMMKRDQFFEAEEQLKPTVPCSQTWEILCAFKKDGPDKSKITRKEAEDLLARKYAGEKVSFP